MSYIWLYATLSAVIFQTLRNSTQKLLKSKLDNIAVTWSRVLFTLPVVLIIAAILFLYFDQKIANNTADYYRFLFFCFLGGLCQIIGTMLLVELFSHRNFVVGITYMKTETIQTAFLGMLFFHETVGIWAILIIIVATIGLVLISPIASDSKNSFKSLLSGFFHKSAMIGIASGFFLSIAALFMKEAVVVSAPDSKFISSIMVLIYVNIFQNLILMVYKIFKRDLVNCLKSMFSQWKLCLLVSIFSLFGTLSWIFAFALQIVAYVKLVGQTEILLSFLISHKFFEEKTGKLEFLGILLITLSVALIALL